MGSQRKIRLMMVFGVGEVGQIREVQIEVFGDVEQLNELVRLGTRPRWPGRYPDQPNGYLHLSRLYWTRRLHFVVVPKRSIDLNLRRRSRNGNDKRRRAKQYHLCTCCSAWPGKPRRDILEDFQWLLQWASGEGTFVGGILVFPAPAQNQPFTLMGCKCSASHPLPLELHFRPEV